jgi:hypothetical protein
MVTVSSTSTRAGQAEPPPLLAGGVAIGAGTFTLVARAVASPCRLTELAQVARGARVALLDAGRAWALGDTPAQPLDLGVPLVCEVGAAVEVPLAARGAALLRVKAQAPGPEGAAPGSSLEVALLRALARAGLPVLVDLGSDGHPAADGDRAPARLTVGWLDGAARLAGAVADAAGVQVALCLPGTGQGLDLTMIPSLRAVSGRPLLVDATAADSRRAAALARAAAAVGADGVVVPAGVAAADADATGRPAGELAETELARLSGELEAVAGALGRRMGGRRIRYVGPGRDDRGSGGLTSEAPTTAAGGPGKPSGSGPVERRWWP